MRPSPVTRARLRAASALVFVAVVSYGGCGSSGSDVDDESLRTAEPAANDDVASGGSPILAATVGRRDADAGQAAVEAAKGTADAQQEARDVVTAAEIVDGLVRLDDLPLEIQMNANLHVDGLAETVHPGDWIAAQDTEIVVVAEPVIPAPAAEPAVLRVVPEATVVVDEGVATVEAEAVEPKEVVVLLVNGENEVVEETVPCPAQCSVEIGDLEAETGGEAVSIETADPSSFALVPEESDDVDQAVMGHGAQSDQEGRAAELDTLRVKRRLLRAEIQALRGELSEARTRIRDEESRIEPELEALRARREDLLDKRQKVADAKGKEKERDALNLAIDTLQDDVKALKSGLEKLRDEWAALRPIRDQIAALRSEMRRLKSEMLEVAQLTEVYCGSRGKTYFECDLDVPAAKVEVARQISKAACTAGGTYGIKEDARGRAVLWVDEGCKAKFLVQKTP